MFNSYTEYGDDGILVDILFENGFCNNEDTHVACKQEYKQCLKCSCSKETMITTPNFPDNYPNDVDMTWLIKVPLWERIRINFHDFKLEKRLKSDYLTISDGDFTNLYIETKDKISLSDKHYNIHQGCAFSKQR